MVTFLADTVDQSTNQYNINGGLRTNICSFGEISGSFNLFGTCSMNGEPTLIRLDSY